MSEQRPSRPAAAGEKRPPSPVTAWQELVERVPPAPVPELRERALQYFARCAGDDSFWRWQAGSCALEWVDGTVVATRDEVAALLRRLQPTGLPDFGAVVQFLASARGKRLKIEWHPARPDEGTNDLQQCLVSTSASGAFLMDPMPGQLGVVGQPFTYCRNGVCSPEAIRLAVQKLNELPHLLGEQRDHPALLEELAWLVFCDGFATEPSCGIVWLLAGGHLSAKELNQPAASHKRTSLLTQLTALGRRFEHLEPQWGELLASRRLWQRSLRSLANTPWGRHTLAALVCPQQTFSLESGVDWRLVAAHESGFVVGGWRDGEAGGEWVFARCDWEGRGSRIVAPASQQSAHAHLSLDREGGLLLVDEAGLPGGSLEFPDEVDVPTFPRMKRITVEAWREGSLAVSHDRGVAYWLEVEDGRLRVTACARGNPRIWQSPLFGSDVEGLPPASITQVTGGLIAIAHGRRLWVLQQGMTPVTEYHFKEFIRELVPVAGRDRRGIMICLRVGVAVLWQSEEDLQLLDQRLLCPMGGHTRSGLLVAIGKGAAWVRDTGGPKDSGMLDFDWPHPIPIAILPTDQADEFITVDAGGLVQRLACVRP